MIQSVIEDELSDQWTPTEYLENVEDSEGLDEITVEPVAVHEDSSELYVQKIDEWWMANLSQSVVFDEFGVDVVTNGETFTDDQKLAQFINQVCDDIDSGTGVIEALAVVPHDGDLESVTTDDIGATEWTTAPQFADVFAIFPNQLPDRVTVDDISAERQEIVELVYGMSEEVPEAMQTLNSSTEAAGQATIQVFTVTGEDIDHHE